MALAELSLLHGWGPRGPDIFKLMKTAYELAMERLKKSAPSPRLTDEQKHALAELESRCAAKTAEREIALKGEITRLAMAGDDEAAEKVHQQWVGERQKLQADLEEKKERIRQGKA